MTAIDVGSAATDRASAVGGGYTIVDLNNPCNASGTITTVEFYKNGTGNVKICIMADAGFGVFFTRSMVDVGYCTAGYHVFSNLSLACLAGDYIGFYTDSGGIDRDTSGGQGHYSYAGDASEAGSYWPGTLAGNYIYSLYGSGADTNLPANYSEIAAALDAVRENEMPAVQTWFKENWFLKEVPDFLVAALLHMVTGGGEGSGTALTLAELKAYMEDELEAFQVRMDAVVTLLNAHAANIRGDIGILGSGHNDLLTELGVAEGNVEAAITVSQGVITDAIEAISAPDLSGIEGAISAAQTAIIGDVDTQTAAVTSAVNAYTDLRADSLDAAIAALHNLSASDLASALAALLTSVEGEIGEGVQTVLAALAALQTSASAPVYPGAANITVGSTASVTGHTTINGTMDGILWTVNSVPPGQSHQPAGARMRYKGLGWIAFKSDGGELEQRQNLELDLGIAVPKSMQHAGGVVIYVKPGSDVDVTPYTNDA